MSKLLNTFVQNERHEDYFEGIAVNLLEITHDCRHSMHEPDEQGITAVVTGKDFDNAGFDSELSVALIRDNGSLRRATFNLASLIALARIGAHEFLNKIEKED